ncbi:MAG: tRNA (adenosine(37)-N6)-dimethylallyltransferase MiaA [Patescibacteria group bacterium]
MSNTSNFHPLSLSKGTAKNTILRPAQEIAFLASSSRRATKSLPKILVIVGPTASGKSALALKLAKKFNGEIVSADSRQIYRGMDIGTAKGKAQIAKSKIAHHLIDIKNPDEEYSLADYKRDALRAIRGILRRGKLPILVGGTGLYVKAIVENLDIPEVKADPKLRKEIKERIEKKGLDSVAEELLKLDPEAAYIVDLKNPRRVVRALEVAIQTGKPFTAQRKKGEPLFDALELGVKLPPVKLRQRIESRVDEMIRAGLVKEVQELLNKYGRTSVLINTIGYREIIDYLAAGCYSSLSLSKGGVQKCYPSTHSGNNIFEQSVPLKEISINQPNQHKSALPQEVAKQIKQNTWAYAKRQMTWFRKDKRINWIKSEKEAESLVKKFSLSFSDSIRESKM